jgi:tryptophan synthase beta chain
MGKPRLLAETGAGQHGVAAATAGARLGLETVVYMGEEDCRRQALNVYRMRLLGAEVVTVPTGSGTLKEAINEAMRDWVANVETSAYCLGSVLGPHPYPKMVREFQSVIGRETREQILEVEGRLPDLLVACVGGGSNSIGLFHPFVDDATVEMVGVEAGGRGTGPGEHAARFAGGSPGVLHGTFTWILQDEAGNILPTHSLAAGLDYPAVGPEHAWLRDRGRARYDRVDDARALAAFHELATLEGILCALETAHALAWAKDAARELGSDKTIVINLSGRGDKDVSTLAKTEGIE